MKFFLKFDILSIFLLIVSSTAGGGFAHSSQIWPSESSGLVYKFQTFQQEIQTLNAEDNLIGGGDLLPSGHAHTDYAGRMILWQGTYTATDIGTHLFRAVQKSGTFSMELLLIPQTTKYRKRASIVTYNDRAGKSNFTLTQQGNKLYLGLRSSSQDDLAWFTISGLAGNTPMHFSLSIGNGRISVYQEGIYVWGKNWNDDFSTWKAGNLLFGGNLDGNGYWAGILEGVALYAGVLDAKQMKDDTETYIDIVANRTPPPSVRVIARLTGKSYIPTSEEIAPYTEALVVNEYAVTKVLNGSYEHRVLYAAHWTILDGRKVSFAETPIGNTIDLTLQPFESVPALQTRYMSDTIVTDFDLPLLYDAGGRSLGLDMMVESSGTSLEPSDEQSGALSVKKRMVSTVEQEKRAAEIQRMLKAVEVRVDAHGGYQAWGESLVPARLKISEVRKEQTASPASAFVGHDDFLFYRSTLSYLLLDSLVYEANSNEGEKEFTRLFETVTTLSADLKKLGVDLIFMPVPTRAEMYPHRIADSIPSDSSLAIHRLEFIHALLNADVEAIDLEPALRELESEGNRPYFKNDSHWNPVGIERATELLAKKLERYDFVTEAKKELKRFSIKKVEYNYPGHIVKSIPKQERDRQPVNKLSLQSTVLANGGRYVPVEDSEIILVGDSFSWLFANRQANIGAQLAYRLNIPLTEKMSEGGGANAPHLIQRLGASDLSKRRVVIWLMAARWLTDPRWRPAHIR